MTVRAIKHGAPSAHASFSRPISAIAQRGRTLTLRLSIRPQGGYAFTPGVGFSEPVEAAKLQLFIDNDMTWYLGSIAILWLAYNAFRPAAAGGVTIGVW